MERKTCQQLFYSLRNFLPHLEHVVQFETNDLKSFPRRAIALRRLPSLPACVSRLLFSLLTRYERLTKAFRTSNKRVVTLREFLSHGEQRGLQACGTRTEKFGKCKLSIETKLIRVSCTALTARI